MKRAERKKLAKQFKVGDVVTWGRGLRSHVVVEVTPTGVYVDVTSHKDSKYFASKQTPDGKILLFVSFDNNNRKKSGRGPISLSNLKPDVENKDEQSRYFTDSLNNDVELSSRSR